MLALWPATTTGTSLPPGLVTSRKDDVGAEDGAEDGTGDGTGEGTNDGVEVGVEVGSDEGTGDGKAVGAAEGWSNKSPPATHSRPEYGAARS